MFNYFQKYILGSIVGACDIDVKSFFNNFKVKAIAMTKNEALQKIEDYNQHFYNEKGENRKEINGVERIVTCAPVLQLNNIDFEPMVYLDGETSMSLDDYIILINPDKDQDVEK